jgi:hypothetical protein
MKTLRCEAVASGRGERRKKEASIIPICQASQRYQPEILHENQSYSRIHTCRYGSDGGLRDAATDRGHGRQTTTHRARLSLRLRSVVTSPRSRSFWLKVRMSMGRTCFRGGPSLVRQQTATSKLDVNTLNKFGYTALYRACIGPIRDLLRAHGAVSIPGTHAP